jgi:predicted nucleic acid-binding protein
MAQYVLDASVAIKWVIAEADSDKADALLKNNSLCAPDWMYVECGNILWRKCQQQLISASHAYMLFDQLRKSPLTVCSLSAQLHTALQLAITLKHPLYDCVYLALALEKGIPLVTADARFHAALSAQPAYRNQVRLLHRL